MQEPFDEFDTAAPAPFSIPLGQSTTFNQDTFALAPEDRGKHMAIFGKTGMGKTTLMRNMIATDLAQGAGVTVIDPHGSLSEDILQIIPKSRTNDVIYLNPRPQAGRVVGLNLLEVADEYHRPLVVSGLISIFKNIWPDAWGPRSEFILSNFVYALLSQKQGRGTLVSLHKLLTDHAYRKQLLKQISDPAIRGFFDLYERQWTKSYREEATAPLLNKVNKFVVSPLLRPVLGQKQSGFDFRQVMDGQKILLCHLPKGSLGPDTAQLLGSIVVTKLALAALSREDVPETERKAHYLYADEVHNFIHGIDLPTILSEARKYKLGLIVASQTLAQLAKEDQAAILGNCGTLGASLTTPERPFDSSPPYSLDCK